MPVTVLQGAANEYQLSLNTTTRATDKKYKAVKNVTQYFTEMLDWCFYLGLIWQVRKAKRNLTQKLIDH